MCVLYVWSVPVEGAGAAHCQPLAGVAPLLSPDQRLPHFFLLACAAGSCLRARVRPPPPVAMSKVAPEVMKEAIETILRLNKEKGRKVRPAAAARPAWCAGRPAAGGRPSQARARAPLAAVARS